MKHDTFFVLLLIGLFAASGFPTTNAVDDEPPWWDTEWAYREQLMIPLDTSQPHAVFQPIDMMVQFSYPCWAQDELTHSIRIICHTTTANEVLESQLYGLNTTEQFRISSCHVVFLIPDYADGSEHYYVYYDDSEQSSPNYPDHLHIEQAYYYFSPIPGFPFESDYYKITQDDFIVYGVAVGGAFLGVSTSQQVTIFQPNTTEVTTPKDGLAYASFDYFYYFGEKFEDFCSTIQHLVSQKIIFDGNLMVRFEIVSQTSKEDFRTTAIYTYYYCPSTTHRRIYAHVKHEALKASQVARVLPYSESCGNIGGFQVGSITSPSIQELNFGRLYPYMHVYSEQNIILEYPLDLDVEYTPEGITILDTEDDVDLGTNAWVSYDEGETGEAHAMIFGSNSVLVSGTDERDGIQVKAIEAAGPGLLGLESDAQSFYLSRNSYEKGSENDLEIPADFVVEYDCEVYSTMTGGYHSVDAESMMFQNLSQAWTDYEVTDEGDAQQTPTYELTVFVHHAPSAPMGTLLSILLGRNFSYISAELYRGDQFVSTNLAQRLMFRQLQSDEELKPLQKIRVFNRFFDLKNGSVFKKVVFPRVEPGMYLVKIFRENPRFSHHRQYIGYTLVEVKEDTTARVWCSREGSLTVSAVDQHDESVAGVMVSLLSDEFVVAQDESDENGSVVVAAPTSLSSSYGVQAHYQGFLVHESESRLGFLSRRKHQEISLVMDLYDVVVRFQDTWQLAPALKISPSLTSEAMEQPYVIYGKQQEVGGFIFNNLVPAEYTLSVQYKDSVFTYPLLVRDMDSEMVFDISTEFAVDVLTFDSRGSMLFDSDIIISRDTKTVALPDPKDGVFHAHLPPGMYQLSVYRDDTVIAKRTIEVIGDRQYSVVTTIEPWYPALVVGIIVLLGVGGGLFFYTKKEFTRIVYLTLTVLIVCSLLYPFWMFHGSSVDSSIDTSTSVFLIPATMVSQTRTPEVLVGEVSSASLPALFTMVLVVISLGLLGAACLLVVNVMFRNRLKRRLLLGILLFSLVFIVGSLLVFFATMSVMTKIGVGSFLGQGTIEYNIPGVELQQQLVCQWGPGYGFYLCLVAAGVIVFLVVRQWKKH